MPKNVELVIDRSRKSLKVHSGQSLDGTVGGNVDLKAVLKKILKRKGLISIFSENAQIAVDRGAGRTLGRGLGTGCWNVTAGQSL